MNEVEIKRFIETYKNFYFKDRKVNFEYYGIRDDLNRTDENLENYIINNKLNKGIYDSEAFAWKAGKAGWKDKRFEYIKPLPYKLMNGNGGQIKLNKNTDAFTVEEFEEYVRRNQISISEDNFDLEEDRKELFLAVKNKYDLHNYGTVYMINHMFFISKGAIPIYDNYAHIAVKALLMKKSPYEVYVPNAPLKNDHPKGKDKDTIEKFFLAVNTLEEYMWLIKEVFPSEIHKNGDTMFISRELDRALWVYGHASKNFFDIQKKRD